MNALLMDNLQGVRQIKAFGRESRRTPGSPTAPTILRRGTLGIMRVWAAYSPAMSFRRRPWALAWCLWVGGRQVLDGTMTIGQLVGFLFYPGLFYEPIARLHGLNQMLQAARAAGERVFDILDADIERNDAVSSPAVALRVAGRWSSPRRSVSVSATEPTAMCCARFLSRARPGQMIALVGPTGAGKSTLVNLLPGFYEATPAASLIDGQDIAERHSLNHCAARSAWSARNPFSSTAPCARTFFTAGSDATEDE